MAVDGDGIIAAVVVCVVVAVIGYCFCIRRTRQLDDPVNQAASVSPIKVVVQPDAAPGTAASYAGTAAAGHHHATRAQSTPPPPTRGRTSHTGPSTGTAPSLFGSPAPAQRGDHVAVAVHDGSSSSDSGAPTGHARDYARPRLSQSLPPPTVTTRGKSKPKPVARRGGDGPHVRWVQPGHGSGRKERVLLRINGVDRQAVESILCKVVRDGGISKKRDAIANTHGTHAYYLRSRVRPPRVKKDGIDVEHTWECRMLAHAIVQTPAFHDQGLLKQVDIAAGALTKQTEVVEAAMRPLYQVQNCEGDDSLFNLRLMEHSFNVVKSNVIESWIDGRYAYGRAAAGLGPSAGSSFLGRITSAAPLPPQPLWDRAAPLPPQPIWDMAAAGSAGGGAAATAGRAGGADLTAGAAGGFQDRPYMEGRVPCLNLVEAYRHEFASHVTRQRRRSLSLTKPVLTPEEVEEIATRLEAEIKGVEVPYDTRLDDKAAYARNTRGDRYEEARLRDVAETMKVMQEEME